MSQRISLLIVMVLFSSLAWAKPVQRSPAFMRYKQGVQQLDAGNFAEAAQLIEGAYAKQPTPAWLYDLGRAQEGAGDKQKALDTYRKFLVDEPNAVNRDDVEKQIAALDAELNPPPPPPPPKKRAPDPELAPPKPVRAADTSWHGTPKTPYEVGVRVRYLFVTNLMLKPYLTAATQMLRGASVAGEFVYHRRTFDVVLSVDYSSFGVDQGNYLSRWSNDPGNDTNFMQFRGLGLLSADVSIIGHYDFNKYVQLRGGAGLGVGVVFGDILVTSSAGDCANRPSDLSACHPNVPGWNAKNPEPSLKASERPGVSDDTPGNPSRHKSKSKPPAMGVLNLVVGARFFLPQKFTLEVELGFRDAMFVGVAAHHRF